MAQGGWSDVLPGRGSSAGREGRGREPCRSVLGRPRSHPPDLRDLLVPHLPPRVEEAEGTGATNLEPQEGDTVVTIGGIVGEGVARGPGRSCSPSTQDKDVSRFTKSESTTSSSRSPRRKSPRPRSSHPGKARLHGRIRRGGIRRSVVARSPRLSLLPALIAALLALLAARTGLAMAREAATPSRGEGAAPAGCRR